jgi:DNA helicase-2/ATP-dependent DNA helicase PcrA
MAYVQLPLSALPITWSAEQRAIFRWFENGDGHLAIRARAGTGKTTTLIEGVNRAPERRILMTAFNKSIAEELQSRIVNPSARARTLHSLGMAFCAKNISGVRVDKGFERARALASRAALTLVGDKGFPVDRQLVNTVAGLHTKIREILVDPLAVYPLARRAGVLTADEQAELANATAGVERFAVQFGFRGDATGFWTDERIVEAALLAVEFAKAETDLIDYADMIFLPLVHAWTYPMCDLLVVDECQDMSAAQLRLALASTIEDGRICICGDDRQAIYGFRGADSGSLDRLKDTLGAEELGLKTTYRCPSEVVSLAQEFVSDYYAAVEAPPGEVVEAASVMGAAPGDFVLSRTNAALVGPCLALIRAGKCAYIKGSEIGKAALSLIEKLGACATLEALQAKLDGWRVRELKKIQAVERELACAGAGACNANDDKRKAVQDQYDVVDAFIEGSDSYAALLANIRATFSDTPKAGAVMCATVHKAKGLEAPGVHLLVETFRRDSLEEDNICYVAATRAKQNLLLLGTRKRFIEGAPERDGDKER